MSFFRQNSPPSDEQPPQDAATRPDEPVEDLRLKLKEYERRFRLLDEQMRVLERERQKLSAVVNHADAGFLVFDSSLRIVWANGVFARRFSQGSHPVGLLGARCNQVLCGRDAICEQCPTAQPFKTSFVAHHEIRLEIHGRPRHIYATAMPIKTLTGEIDQTIVMLQDVSNLEILRQSQEALRASEERFRSIFEGAATGMATLSPEGLFLQVNPAFCRFLGFTEAELQRVNFLDVTHPEDREMSRRVHSDFVANPGQPAELEKRYVRKDGTTAWALTTAQWLYDPQKRPICSVALVQDIGRRKQAEEALRQSEARKGAILETALDAIITMDHQGRITEFNPAAEKTFGRRREDVLGQKMTGLLIPPALRERHGRGLERYLKTSEPHLLGKRIEITAQRADGTEFPVEIAIARIPHPGPPLFTGFVRDITERKQAEEALRRSEEQLREAQKMEAVGNLAGGVAHDFNNILTGILGYAEILKMGSPSPEKVQKAAQVIGAGAQRAARLTEQLLGFARRGKHLNVRVDLNSVIRKVMEVLGRTVDAKIQIQDDFGAEGGALVLGDPAQIHQVILNLAFNAVEAMPDGGTLTFGTQRVRLDAAQGHAHGGMAPGAYLRVTVADTGHGIPPEVRERIFEPFFTTKERGKGTGMGLAMVYGIVKNHGGFIDLQSAPGQGTTFSLTLPLFHEASAASEEDGQVEKATAARAGRILVVDDEEIVRNVAEEFLSRLGYEVLTAADGQEAVEAYRLSGAGIDLVILDMVMPRLGGRECFRALREMNPALRAILSTGYGLNVAAQEILDEGMLGFIQKPYQMDQLSEVVAKALRN